MRLGYRGCGLHPEVKGVGEEEVGDDGIPELVYNYRAGTTQKDNKMDMGGRENSC